MWSICRAHIMLSWAVSDSGGSESVGGIQQAWCCHPEGLGRPDNSLSFPLSTPKHFTDIRIQPLRMCLHGSLGGSVPKPMTAPLRGTWGPATSAWARFPFPPACQDLCSWRPCPSDSCPLCPSLGPSGKGTLEIVSSFPLYRDNMATQGSVKCFEGQEVRRGLRRCTQHICA